MSIVNEDDHIKGVMNAHVTLVDYGDYDVFGGLASESNTTGSNAHGIGKIYGGK